jgi:hypothetical protein
MTHFMSPKCQLAWTFPTPELPKKATCFINELTFSKKSCIFFLTDGDADDRLDHENPV